MNFEIEESTHLDFSRGDIVVATEDLDPEGADVQAGTFGVVFDHIRDPLTGDVDPMVRWFSGTACTVFPGDARLVSPSEVKTQPTNFLRINTRCHSCQSEHSTTFSVSAELLNNRSVERTLTATQLMGMTVQEIVQFFEKEGSFPHLFPNATRAEPGREDTTERVALR